MRTEQLIELDDRLIAIDRGGKGDKSVKVTARKSVDGKLIVENVEEITGEATE